MRKLFFAPVIFTLLLALGAGPLPLQAKETIKIGVILPLSGSQDTNGQDCRAAVQMRLDEQAAKTDSKYEYKAIFEDGQNIPRVSVEAFWKLKSMDKVDAVTSIFGGPSSVIATTANNAGILHIGVAFANAVAKKPYSFNVFSKPGPGAELLAKLLSTAGYKRIAIIGQQHASTNALEEAFVKIAPSHGITIVNIQKFAPPEKDFRVAILKIREAKPEILLLHAFDPEIGIIKRQMHEIAFDIPVTAMAHWGTYRGDVLYGIPYVETVGNADFLKRLSPRVKHEPIYFSGALYDATDMIMHVSETYTGSGKPSSEYMAKEIQGLKNYPGVMGILTPDENGWFDTPPAIAVQTPAGRKEITIDEAVRLMKERTKGIK